MPRLILGVLLVGQAILAFRFGGVGRPAGGDEPYYIAKARYLREHHRFEGVSAHAMEVERGRAWGDSDWRPQGYPLFVALCAVGDFRIVPLRFRVTVGQFVILALVLMIAFLAIERKLSMPARYGAAVLFGVAPWPFEFVTLIGPDSLNASLTLSGALIVWRGQTPLRVFAGSMLLMSTILFRPEMAGIAPLVICVAVSLQGRERWLRRAGAAAIAVVLIVGAQLAYRRTFTGHWTLSLYGGLHIRDRGAFEWVSTWFGTEAEAYDFVYGLTNANLRTRLPDRAFGDTSERRLIETAIESVRRGGGLSSAADADFKRVAEKRKSEHPVTANILPRIWHALHLWLNLETNTQLLGALARLPPFGRRAFLAFLLALKGVVYGQFIVSLLRLPRFHPEIRRLVLIMATIVVARTLLIGVVLNWMAHRYVLVAWPAMLECVIAALSSSKRGSEPQA